MSRITVSIVIHYSSLWRTGIGVVRVFVCVHAHVGVSTYLCNYTCRPEST